MKNENFETGIFAAWISARMFELALLKGVDHEFVDSVINSDDGKKDKKSTAGVARNESHRQGGML